MKKILAIIAFSFCFLTSCREDLKENINVYVDKNLMILIKEIVKVYENKNKSIKINIITEKPENIENLDIILSADEKIFISTMVDTGVKKKADEINHKNLFLEDFFAEDNVVLIGRKKLHDFDELLYSHIATPNYDNIVGKIFVDNISDLELFKEISKRIEYTDDSISAMQSVDLYEADYAVINTLLLDSVKNSEICLAINKNNKNGKKVNEIIIYNRYRKKESSENVKDFYDFLESKKVQKIIETHKKV